MRNLIHALCLTMVTFGYASEGFTPIKNTGFDISKNEKSLNVFIDESNNMTHVEISRLGTKEKFELGVELSENIASIPLENFKTGSYLVSIFNNHEIEDVLIYVGEKEIQVVDRRFVSKPIYQQRDRKYKINVLKSSTPISLQMVSDDGTLLLSQSFSKKDLANTTFLFESEIDTVTTTLHYDGKEFVGSVKL